MLDCYDCGLPAEVISKDDDPEFGLVYIYQCVVGHEKAFVKTPRPSRKGL